jgi:protein-L-isoaspartate(D-aspartate) O-methyltransferase
VILIGGAVDEVPDVLLDQLGEHGRLITVIPDRHVSDRCHAGQATVFLRTDGGIARRPLFDAAVPPLSGFTREPGFVF